MLYDAVVVGGGPIGSYVAYRLADMGYQVVVVEQKPKLGGKVCCTGIIGWECIESFGIDRNVILKPVNSARLFSPSGKVLRLHRPQTQACVVDRSAFDIAMASRAQHKGAEYVLDSAVANIVIGGDRAGVVMAQRGLNFEARAVIAATGFSSRLVERLGLGRIGDFAMGAQAEVATPVLDEIEVYFGREIAPAFFAWLVPTSPGKALVGLMSRRSPRTYLRKLMSSLLAQGKIVSAEAEPSYGGIPLKPLTRTYGERLIVVGDAAGQVKPTSGGGIYYGLLSADIAAEILHLGLKKDDLSAKSLASYERRWRKKLGRELRIGYWARKFYERLSDGQIDGIFDLIRSKGIDEVLLRTDELSFDWHSKVILRLAKHLLFSKVSDMVKIPFRPR